MVKHLQNVFRVQSFRWIWVLSAIIWFALLGHRDLIEPDEARYAEIPREMVASGDWVTPRLNGFKYFEKPALQYWATAVSYELFGQSNATARLYLALIGFLGAIFTGFVAARLFGLKVGHSAFIICISSLLFVVGGHYLTLDMSVSVFMAMGVGSFALAHSNRQNLKNCRNWMLIGWASLGLAVLSKGLMGIVLPGAAVFLYSLWQRDWQMWKHLHIVKGLGVFLAITAPWFIKVSMVNPEFAEFFFIHEHFDRYTTDQHHKSAPLYFFLPIFLLGAAPWILSSLRALFTPDFRWKPEPDEGFNALRFFWTYVIFVILFFSLGDSKLHLYILPVFPFVAILAGHKVVKTNSLMGERWVMLFLALLFFVVGIIITRFASDKHPLFIWEAYRLWIIAAAFLYLFAAVLLFRWNSKPHRVMGIVGLAALLGTQSILWGSSSLAYSRSSRDIVDQIQLYSAQHGWQDDVPVYAVEGSYPQSVPFYLGRTIQLVQSVGELGMGIKAEPEKWIPDQHAFVKRWNKEKQAFAIFENQDVARYQSLIPMDILYANSKRTLAVKPQINQP